MSNARETEQGITESRTSLLGHLISVLNNKSQETFERALETMRSKRFVDGPKQSKQPDEMIRLEIQAGTLQQQAVNLRERAQELKDLLQDYQSDGKIKAGSILMWELLDPDLPQVQQETVVITPGGGGKIDNIRLLSEKAPLAKALIGKTKGETVVFGEISISIKEVT